MNGRTLSVEGRVSRHNYASVDVSPEHITPLYDNLLVRRLDNEEHKGLIVSPDMQQTLDGRWVKKTDSGLRRGIVVSVGRGDKIPWHCTWCMEPMGRDPVPDELWWICPKCGTAGCSDRKSMEVYAPGMIILYPRFESSHIKIGDQMYTFVREADVMAVLEQEREIECHLCGKAFVPDPKTYCGMLDSYPCPYCESPNSKEP